MKLILALALAPAAAFVAPPRLTAPATPTIARMSDEAAPEVPVVEAAAPEAAAEAPAAKPKRADKSKAMPLADLVEGQEYEGKVTGIAAYGAFVDIGAQSDGLVHISELSASYVEDVGAVVKEGDAVSVRVLKIDTGKKQLSLSMKPEGSAPPPKRERGPRKSKKAGAEELRKYLDADPEEYVKGTVRTVLEWGAFINIAEGVDGLCHISRVSDDRIEDLPSHLSVGQEVNVRVIDVDLDKATLALAMNTYRDPTQMPPPRRRPADAGEEGGENAAARRARNPGAGGGQRKPRRMDPGDDIWESKDTFDWKDVMDQGDAGDADELGSGFVVDLETGKLTLQ